MTGHDALTITLANDYAEACAAVQPAWIAMLRTPMCDHYTVVGCNCVRRQAMRVYFEAGQVARAAHARLINHAARGGSEVGL